MDFNINRYPELKEAIERDNLVLFVGAGCSLKLKNTNSVEIGNWDNLVKNIFQHLKNRGHEISHLENALATESALKVLEFFEKFHSNIDKSSTLDFVVKFLDLDKTKNDFSFHKLLCSLSTKIITTNYDNAFELSNPEIFDNYVIRGDNLKIEKIKYEKNFLLKLHGCFKREDSLVLFKSDYQRLYENNDDIKSVHLLTCLTNLFYNKTILFIGYGMGDDEINLILKNIQKVTHQYSHKHYIIANKLDEDLKSFLIHIPISDFNELPEVINKLIDYKVEFEKRKNKEFIELGLGEIKSKYKILIEELFKEGLNFQMNSEFEYANIKYSQISRLKKNASVFNNWGNSFQDLAKLKNDESLYIQSFEKYQKATDLKPNYDSAFNNWGVSIMGLAKLKKDKSLYRKSFKKYQKATELNPNYVLAFINWGVAIQDLAKLENDEILYQQCFEKYQKAIELNPIYASAFDNWGIAIFELAKLKNEPEKEKLLIESEQKLLKGIELGLDNFNLACLYSIWNKKEKALENLEITLKNKEIEVSNVETDEDWKNYWEDEDFKTLMNKYRT